MSNVSTSSGNTEPKSSTKHECGSDNASEKADGSSQSKAAISKAVANRAAHAPYC